MAEECDGEFGPQGDFSDLGLECCSHKCPQIEADKNDSYDIKLTATKCVKFTSKLVLSGKEDEDLSKYVFSQRFDKYILFTINFPESGNYKFQIFALPADTKETSLPNVYNYKINVPSANRAAYAFPKQYAQWKEGCCLEGPLTLHSKSSLTAVNFKVTIPKAEAAAVVVNGKEWHHLEKKGNVFTLDKLDLHKLRDSNAKVTLNACFDEKSGSYPTLLEYTL